MRSLLVSLFLAAALAQTTVITTDAQVQASLVARATSDVRTFITVALPIGSTATAVGVRVQSSGNTASSDAVVVLSSGISFPMVQWSHYASSITVSSPSNADRSASTVSTTFKSLAVVTYNDTNGNGKFDFGEGIAADLLSDGLYSVSKSDSTATGGGQVSLITTKRSDNSFGFRYSVQNRPVANQGQGIGADALKIDVWITPKTALTGNQRLALVASYSSFQSDATGSGSFQDGNLTLSGSSRVQFNRNGKGAALQWANTARVAYSSGIVATVGVTSEVLNLKGSATLTVAGRSVVDSDFSFGRFLVFSFDANAPSQIYWDPAVGDSDSVPSSGSAATLTLSVALVLALVALLL